jgi:hypothetical protein
MFYIYTDLYNMYMPISTYMHKIVSNCPHVSTYLLAMKSFTWLFMYKETIYIPYLLNLL